ncbi:unnamed protein product [Polarella glacialis]|uniref:Uncharacterized protein n=1 Tax=Polarella glacialis TaxID=89957 RepID=A0A813FPN0_POLGL|nr:unnamed protein product [Polarella glacialis]
METALQDSDAQVSSQQELTAPPLSMAALPALSLRSRTGCFRQFKRCQVRIYDGKNECFRQCETRKVAGKTSTCAMHRKLETSGSAPEFGWTFEDVPELPQKRRKSVAPPNPPRKDSPPPPRPPGDTVATLLKRKRSSTGQVIQESDLETLVDSDVGKIVWNSGTCAFTAWRRVTENNPLAASSTFAVDCDQKDPRFNEMRDEVSLEAQLWLCGAEASESQTKKAQEMDVYTSEEVSLRA